MISPSSRRWHRGLLQRLARKRSGLPHRAARQPRMGNALLYARSRRLHHRSNASNPRPLELAAV